MLTDDTIAPAGAPAAEALLDAGIEAARAGGRVLVRFNHFPSVAKQSLLICWSRRLHFTFLAAA